MPRFVPGLELAAAFYEETIGPLLAGVEHSAALIGSGSDVLGFDTEQSTDHGWGARLQVFVEPGQVEAVWRAVDAGLPNNFRGWPTRFGWDDVPVSHHVEVSSLGEWLSSRLGFDPRDGMSSRRWLSTPQQRLLEITSGANFHDPTGELKALRDALAWYPEDVWLWLLACQWRRIDQEEAFPGRAAEVGDELGSRSIVARLVRDVIRLAFLLERRYAPYSKWLGTAFGRLDAAESLRPTLMSVLSATSYSEREEALAAVMEELAARQNALGITRSVDPTMRLFHTRPFRVLGSARFVEACLDRLSDPWLKSLPLIGGIDQFVDSTDLLEEPRLFGVAASLFQPDV